MISILTCAYAENHISVGDQVLPEVEGLWLCNGFIPDNGPGYGTFNTPWVIKDLPGLTYWSNLPQYH